MAYLPCDNCGSGDTNAFGSWNTPIKILCGKCSKESTGSKVNLPPQTPIIDWDIELKKSK